MTTTNKPLRIGGYGIETNIAYLPLAYRCAVERLDADASLRTFLQLRGLCDDYAAAYGLPKDDTHFKHVLGAAHICRRRFDMKDCALVEELAPGLPMMCYAEHPSTGETVIVRLGEPGYEISAMFKGDPAAYNARLGVNDAQAEAMLIGSMFGWACKAANPTTYEKDRA